jgi:uncharacterized repeat protein (TIGR02543 family)
MSFAKPDYGKTARGRILAFLIIAALAIALIAPAGIGSPSDAAYAATSSDPSSEWPTLRGDLANKGITDAPTATAGKYAKKNWEYVFREDAGGLISSDPLLIDDKIYIAVSNGEDFMMTTNKPRIVVLNKKGELVDSVDIKGVNDAEVGLPLVANIGYGAGKLYVPLTDGTICAYDAKTLEFKWQSEAITAGAEVRSSITYKGGYIYSGASTGTGDKGCFFALNAEDGALKWKYGTKGYYCAGAAFTSKAVFFAGDDGVLVSHALKSEDIFGAYSLNGSVRSETVIKDSVLYVTTKAGKLYRVPLEKDGKTFTKKKKNIKSATLSGPECTTAPVVYNNKVYTISAKSAYITKSTLQVWDATTLKKKSSVKLGAYVDDEPLLTTAYATKDNGYKVYLYVLKNEWTTDDLLLITDSEKIKKPTVKKLYSPGGDSAMSSAIAAADGTLYFYHSSTTSTANPNVYYYAARLVSLANTAKKYTVKLNANKGKAAPKSIKVYRGAKYNTLPTPTRKGYKFKGWYTKKSGGSKITAASTVTIKKNTKLYARWKKK